MKHKYFIDDKVIVLIKTSDGNNELECLINSLHRNLFYEGTIIRDIKGSCGLFMLSDSICFKEEEIVKKTN